MAVFDGNIFDSNIFDTGSVESSFSASAVIAATEAGSFTANAVVLDPGRVAVFDGNIFDSNIFDTGGGTTVGASLSADAVIMPLFTADAVIVSDYRIVEGSFSADAVIAKTQSFGSKADAIILKAISVDRTIDAKVVLGPEVLTSQVGIEALTQSPYDLRVYQAGIEALTQNPYDLLVYQAGLEVLREVPRGSFSVGAVIFAQVAGSLSIDAYAGGPPVFGSLTADAIRMRPAAFSANANAVIYGTVSKQFLIESQLSYTLFSGFDVAAVVLRAIGGTFTGSAIVRSPDRSGSFSIDARAAYTQFGSITADATIYGTVLRSFTAAASTMLRRSGSTTIDAFVSNPYRVRHDRGNSAHYHSDPDAVLYLADAIGVYEQGANVHDVLVAIYDRIAQLEQEDNQLP
jgi:hypothetical protein